MQRHRVHPAVFSQCRDMADNDNQSEQMKVQAAQAMRRWAEDRANDPGFAEMVAAARFEAAVTMQQHRVRGV